MDKSPTPETSKESSPKSGKGSKGKNAKGNGNQGKGRSKGVEKIDQSLYPYERRAARVVAEEGIRYSSDCVGCPLPGCDSKGNVDQLMFPTINVCVLANQSI